MKTVLLIDGENFKGKIKHVFKITGKDRPVWHEYDFKQLFEKVLANTSIDEKIFYFARVKEHSESKEKSQQLIEEQRRLKTHLERQGFKVILSGRVRGHYETDFKGKTSLVFKEKGVDVKIAVDMISMACDNYVKHIILASSDSDLQPAISEIRKRGTDCTYLGFETQPNKGLTFTTNKTILIRDSEVLENEKVQRSLLD
jgi:uncharacterized LabA/DUF88 family protein